MEVYPEAGHEQVLRDESRFPALIHGDVTFPNVIMHSNGLYLIDWNQVRMESTYYEIAKTLLNTTNFNPLWMGALLQGEWLDEWGRQSGQP
ncbi:phosphotransferase [Paenibacillus thiaminolyticus]|uniref:Phosphotransferase n=1 Tax=Paenibacillus thiaminolyticus TaxID=49283 RepID=A0AAP9DYZ5_PANTH|nr:phosphotransferase [Paenibacillus thiaminolyticus]MCY9534193.1 phosphotransferase [Paenibacillus thiaminolyticus]MCY9604712.1 phosphotransferase [Paenibacillus thiaminolyticus]MCY9610129.1 phosphotransferase [Paenibacillus thiaminolyticus]MCY9614638.1 phosphotransferase [Paenibacillus thiaminolyticus]MCY9621823.1 phosphotransferase [Paenibacillus thiaminolyticus]